MSALHAAARRLLEGATGEPRFPAHRAAVLAAAAVSLECGQAGALASFIDRMHSRGLAFFVAAAAEALRPCGRRAVLIDLSVSIPRDERVVAVTAAECYLARIEPEWAAAIVERFIPAEEIAQSGVLGLSIAAFAHDDRARVPRWVGFPPQSRVIYARALAADTVARAAARGVVAAKNDPVFSPLHDDPGARLLLPFEASSYLVAAAMVDPAWGLELASAMLATHSPLDMTDALYFCARCAMRSGLGPQVVARSQSGEFVLEQACWIEAAARAGALDRSQVSMLCATLADRVSDELSEEGATAAGTSLLMALAHVDVPDLLVEHAEKWRIPPEVVVDAVFHSAIRNGVPGLIARFPAYRDVLVLTASLPWLVTPGSLLDLTCVAGQRDSLLRD